MPPRILVLDADPHIANLYAEFLMDEGYRVLIAQLPACNVGMIHSLAPDLIILDYMLGPGSPGQQLLAHLAACTSDRWPAIVISTAAIQEARAAQCQAPPLRLEVVLKPFELDHLLFSIERALAIAPPSRLRLQERIPYRL